MLKWTLVLSWFIYVGSEDLFLTRYDQERLASLREEVRELFHHGYDNYMQHAFPHDELKPISKTYTDSLPELGRSKKTKHIGYSGLALTLIDSLDSLVVMGEYEEFANQVQWVGDNISFDVDVDLNLFECNIRLLGGLLSAHTLAMDPSFFAGLDYGGELLRLASDLGDRMLRAFATPTHIPYAWFNLKLGTATSAGADAEIQCTAGATTFTLEFAALSELTGNSSYVEAAVRSVEAVWMRRSGRDLVGNTLNAKRGSWIDTHSGIGAGIDSFYEYLAKGYAMLPGPVGDKLFTFWRSSYLAVLRNLKVGPWYVSANMYSGKITHHQFGSLQAFWPAVQVGMGDVDNAIETHAAFYSIWRSYGLLPEAFQLNSLSVHPSMQYYPLRPELAESTYMLYEATRDPFYLRVGEDIFRSIAHAARTPHGIADVKNVLTGELEDHMSSFFLAETCKYLYLLFCAGSNPVTTSLSLAGTHVREADRAVGGAPLVFTTEGHFVPMVCPATSEMQREEPGESPDHESRNSASGTHDEGRKSASGTEEGAGGEENTWEKWLSEERNTVAAVRAPPSKQSVKGTYPRAYHWRLAHPFESCPRSVSPQSFLPSPPSPSSSLRSEPSPTPAVARIRRCWVARTHVGGCPYATTAQALRRNVFNGDWSFPQPSRGGGMEEENKKGGKGATKGAARAKKNEAAKRREQTAKNKASGIFQSYEPPGETTASPAATQGAKKSQEKQKQSSVKSGRKTWSSSKVKDLTLYITPTTSGFVLESSRGDEVVDIRYFGPGPTAHVINAHKDKTTAFVIRGDGTVQHHHMTMSVDIPGDETTAEAIIAEFSPQITESIFAEVVVSSPRDGCSALVTESMSTDYTGKIVLVERGTCLFVEKAQNAETAGAVAMVVMNTDETAFVMGGGGEVDPVPSLPCLMVPAHVGTAIETFAQAVFSTQGQDISDTDPVSAAGDSEQSGQSKGVAPEDSAQGTRNGASGGGEGVVNGGAASPSHEEEDTNVQGDGGAGHADADGESLRVTSHVWGYAAASPSGLSSIAASHAHADLSLSGARVSPSNTAVSTSGMRDVDDVNDVGDMSDLGGTNYEDRRNIGDGSDENGDCGCEHHIDDHVGCGCGSGVNEGSGGQHQHRTADVGIENSERGAGPTAATRRTLGLLKHTPTDTDSERVFSGTSSNFVFTALGGWGLRSEMTSDQSFRLTLLEPGDAHHSEAAAAAPPAEKVGSKLRPAEKKTSVKPTVADVKSVKSPSAAAAAPQSPDGPQHSSHEASSDTSTAMGHSDPDTGANSVPIPSSIVGNEGVLASAQPGGDSDGVAVLPDQEGKTTGKASMAEGEVEYGVNPADTNPPGSNKITREEALQKVELGGAGRVTDEAETEASRKDVSRDTEGGVDVKKDTKGVTNANKNVESDEALGVHGGFGCGGEEMRRGSLSMCHVEDERADHTCAAHCQCGVDHATCQRRQCSSHGFCFTPGDP